VGNFRDGLREGAERWRVGAGGWEREACSAQGSWRMGVAIGKLEEGATSLAEKMKPYTLSYS
jgi:hypothetical protein